MDDETRRKRETDIHQAAYDLLAQHGYGGTSMLRIAKAARASNETLYRWYGNKDELFKAMARNNAAEARQTLSRALGGRDNPWVTLAAFAPVFLRMITGERAILLNRAAAADPSGALGATISAGGRNEIMPLLEQLMQRICEGTTCNPEDVSRWFVSLLVGDIQIRRVINEQSALCEREIESLCKKTLPVLRRLIESQVSLDM